MQSRPTRRWPAFALSALFALLALFVLSGAIAGVASFAAFMTFLFACIRGLAGEDSERVQQLTRGGLIGGL